MQVSYFPNELPIRCLYINQRRLKGGNTTFKNRALSHVPNKNNDVPVISICNPEGLAMLIKAFCNINNKYRDYSQQMSPEY